MFWTDFPIMIYFIVSSKENLTNAAFLLLKIIIKDLVNRSCSQIQNQIFLKYFYGLEENHEMIFFLQKVFETLP